MSTADEEPRSASTQDALKNPDPTNYVAATAVDLNSSGQTTKRDEEKQRNESPPLENQTANVVNTLLPKFLRTTRMLLDSRSFFFSYDLDITRRLGNQNTKSSELPLHKSVDPLVSRGLLILIMFESRTDINLSTSGINTWHCRSLRMDTTHLYCH